MGKARKRKRRVPTPESSHDDPNTLPESPHSFHTVDNFEDPYRAALFLGDGMLMATGELDYRTEGSVEYQVDDGRMMEFGVSPVSLEHYFGREDVTIKLAVKVEQENEDGETVYYPAFTWVTVQREQAIEWMETALAGLKQRPPRQEFKC